MDGKQASYAIQLMGSTESKLAIMLFSQWVQWKLSQLFYPVNGINGNQVSYAI